MAKKKYNFIDLFCGAGGFAKGFEMTNKFQCIGGIDNKQSKSFKTNYAKDLPIQRMMKKHEILGLVKFLLSKDSAYCTGSEFFIDGGWNAR